MNKDKFWLNIIYILSAVLSIAVAFLILGPRPEGVEGSIDISYLPFTNATLNFITTILLLVGYFFIRQKKREKHRLAMLSAFFSSALFLISYIIYHWFKSGPKKYIGEYPEIYFFILITHIILAAIIIPLALITLYRGWTNSLPKHKKIARITMPIWLYVSVTGVVIYVMLY